ncbi:hypothetical protein SAMN05216559_0224 [Halomicrobium zhouii]|uniref:Uncharacterized protein n=1 Tax=Halomicrobium zhouii TaxID=767519 RepID=A0A1I6K5E0_9EURY|nr:DUF6653 family protein [Halomicrobium zhouii]SFR86473.1 hypothetical protein SAMN05216559_0224 [Halomicrobium zhouii]
MTRTAEGDLRDCLEDAFWSRHSNPKSGWSRTLTGPLLLLALYRRSWRLFVFAVAFTALNPVLFGRPDPEAESWMKRAVEAERWWLAEGNATMNLGWPNVLNVANVPTFCYALLAAYRRQPVRATVALAASMGLKFGWIELIARQYDESQA